MRVEIRNYKDTDFLSVSKIIKDNFNIEKKDGKKDGCLEFVACIENEVVGYFVLNIINDVVKDTKWMLVEYVCVDLEHQGLGIGTEMMEFVIDYAKKLKITYLELTSGYERKVAHHIYEKLGFVKRESNIYRRIL